MRRELALRAWKVSPRLNRTGVADDDPDHYRADQSRLDCTAEIFSPPPSSPYTDRAAGA